jgi:hypothetical protein
MISIATHISVYIFVIFTHLLFLITLFTYYFFQINFFNNVLKC